MVHWNDKPHEILSNLIGCAEQCPLCGEQCNRQDPNHVASGKKHFVSMHRPSCLAGYRLSDESQLMVIGSCPAYVSEHKSFKHSHTNHKPQNLFEDWSIPPDVTCGDSLYWKLFVGKYMNRIAKWFDAKPPVLSALQDWSKTNPEKVKEHLNHLFTP